MRNSPIFRTRHPPASPAPPPPPPPPPPSTRSVIACQQRKLPVLSSQLLAAEREVLGRSYQADLSRPGSIRADPAISIAPSSIPFFKLRSKICKQFPQIQKYLQSSKINLE